MKNTSLAVIALHPVALFLKVLSYKFKNRLSVMPMLLLLLFVSACSTPVEHDEQKVVFREGEKHILLMHPTVNNLKIFRYLTENGIFPLPEGLRAVGVYHVSGAYDYSQSHDYIHEEGLDHIALLALEPELTQDMLFGSNALSGRFRDLFEQSEGMILFGGPDIPPAMYGLPTSLLTVITDPHRHYLEASYLFHLLGGYQDETFAPFMEENNQYRILGICLGMQTMNIATGGTMTQDIPFEIYGLTTVEEVLALDADLQHRNYHTNYRHDSDLDADSYHHILIEPNSAMARVAGDATLTPVVLSSHHQAAKKIGTGWKVTAWCTDRKIVEAIEHTRYPNVLGVQFHPERIKIYDGRALKKVPHQLDGKPYPEHFTGEQGEDFHRSFWQFVAGMYDDI